MGRSKKKKFELSEFEYLGCVFTDDGKYNNEFEMSVKILIWLLNYELKRI